MRFKIFGQPSSLWRKKNWSSWEFWRFLIDQTFFSHPASIQSHFKGKKKGRKTRWLDWPKNHRKFFDSLWKVRRRLESGWKWSWNLNCEPTHEAKAQQARNHYSVSLRVLQIVTTRWWVSTEFPTRRSSFPTTTTTSSTSSRRRWRRLEFFTKTGWQLNSFWPQRTTLILACYFHRQQSQSILVLVMSLLTHNKRGGQFSS